MKSFLSRNIFYIFILLLFSSCGINSNLMFKIPKQTDEASDSLNQSKYYKLFKADSIPVALRDDYKISVDDKISFTLSANDGQKILESLSGVGGAGAQSSSQQVEYVVRSDGYVSLPVIGDINLTGLTVKQCEDTLIKYYGKHYLDPFVQLKVTNQRVIVFPGEGGQAKVIFLKNNNTTLMEVIAEAGGISQRGKAKSIKLMRSVNGRRDIYPIDLSTIEGLAYADMIVQTNDYIYIEPNAKLGREALAQATPFFALLSTFMVVFTLINTIK